MYPILSLHLLKKSFSAIISVGYKKINVIINSSDLFRRQYVLHLIHNNFCVIKKKKASGKVNNEAMWRWDD